MCDLGFDYAQKLGAERLLTDIGINKRDKSMVIHGFASSFFSKNLTSPVSGPGSL